MIEARFSRVPEDDAWEQFLEKGDTAEGVVFP